MAELRATKRNPLLGLLADALSPVADYLSTSTNPLEDAGSDLSVTGLLGDTIRPVANTVNRMSYGEPLTTGRGMTTQMRPDTRDALLAVSPMGVGTKAAGRGVKAGAQALSPQAERMLMDTMRKMGGIKEITAYHGSPHTFDKFSLDKIGTGEGAQVYGHGLYFADNPEVAQQYRDVLAGGPEALYKGLNKDTLYDRYSSKPRDKRNSDPDAIEQYIVMDLARTIEDQGITPDQAIQRKKERIIELLNKYSNEPQSEAYQYQKSALDFLNSVDKNDFEVGQKGAFYKVDIPDEAVANMLLWDKPLSEQPVGVNALLQLEERNRLKDIAKRKIEARAELVKRGGDTAPIDRQIDLLMEEINSKNIPFGGTGETFYKSLRNKLGDQNKATEYLKQLGIPGIRYLDQGSRGTGQGTMNTVLFDDALVKILERNGVPMQGLLD